MYCAVWINATGCNLRQDWLVVVLDVSHHFPKDFFFRARCIEVVVLVFLQCRLLVEFLSTFPFEG